MPGYSAIHLDEVTAREGATEGSRWLPLRHTLGVGAFGINAYRAPEPGVEVIERHDEAGEDGLGHEEVYVVLAGSARFYLGGEEVLARAGTVVFVEDPKLERVAIADAPDTVVLAVGAQRGKAFEPSDWEEGWLEAKRTV